MLTSLQSANQPSNILGPNHPLWYPGDAGYLRAECYGPSKDRGCPVGARVVGPCAHGVTALFAGCVLPQFPVLQYLRPSLATFIIQYLLPPLAAFTLQYLQPSLATFILQYLRPPLATFIIQCLWSPLAAFTLQYLRPPLAAFIIHYLQPLLATLDEASLSLTHRKNAISISSALIGKKEETFIDTTLHFTYWLYGAVLYYDK